METGSGFFACPEEMHGALRQALEKAPIRKAAVVDKLKSEMLKIDIEASTNLLFELWAACRRCGNLPQAWLMALLVPLHKKGEQDAIGLRGVHET